MWSLVHRLRYWPRVCSCGERTGHSATCQNERQLLVPRLKSRHCQHRKQAPLPASALSIWRSHMLRAGLKEGMQRNNEETYNFASRLLIEEQQGHTFGLSVVDTVVLYPCRHKGTCKKKTEREMVEVNGGGNKSEWDIYIQNPTAVCPWMKCLPLQMLTASLRNFYKPEGVD